MHFQVMKQNRDDNGTLYRYLSMNCICILYSRGGWVSCFCISIQNRKLLNIVLLTVRITQNIYRPGRKVCNNEYITYIYIWVGTL